MKRRAFLVLSVAVSGCLETVGEDGDDIREPEDLEIVWSDLVRDNPGTEAERVYVWGVVRNESDRELTYVEIRATFLDADGEELETVIENVEDVTTGEEWEFDVEFPDFGERAAAVDDYELEPATGV